MLLNLSSDQEFFRDTTAKFLRELVPVGELRRLRDEPAGFDPDYWRRGAELGWTSLLVSEANGGGSISGDGLVDLTLVAHEFGAHAAPGPLVATNVVASALSDTATGEHDDLLAGLLAGTTIATWCSSEPRPNDRLGQVTMTIRVEGDELVLDGIKRPVESAEQASHLLVTGRTETGITQVLVPTDAAGVTITPMHTVDLTRRFSRVTFTDVRVPIGSRVGELGGAAAQVERQLQLAVVIANAESVGAMQVALDMTVEWAFDRYSFGRPLSSYQALKHRFADMTTWLEASHAVSDGAAAAVSAGTPDAAELVSSAKAFIGDYGSELMHDCVQIHGGIGVTYEHDLHLYLRRHTVDRALYGTPAEHRERITSIIETETAGMSVDQINATADDVDLEDLERFRQRARTWIRAELRPLDQEEASGILRNVNTDEEELVDVADDRALQRKLFDAGFAGLCMPRAYGGQGLTPAHQRVFNEEIVGYEFPTRIQAPTMSPCAAVLLDFGTEAQKQAHIPAILKGEELWMQFLSEPGSGSDVAGAVTTALRDGDEWVLNGSKVWTTGAWWSDWGLCLTRTNWDVPKHRGLSVFIFPIHQDGIEVHRIEMLNGSQEFCEEYLTDVRVPDTDRVGEVDDGWTVGTRWMFHERMLNSSPYVTKPARDAHGGVGSHSVQKIARESGHADDVRVRDLVGEAHMLEVVAEQLRARIGEGLSTGTMNDQSAAIGRLFGGMTATRTVSIAFEIAGADGAAWTDDDGVIAEVGNDFLMRQIPCIGGGTTEMARNVISERVLGMPRERSYDRDTAFRDVPRGPST